VLDGSRSGEANGLTLVTPGSSNSTVRGLVIDNFGIGINIATSFNDLVEGNFIGTDVSGTYAAGNYFTSASDGAGIRLFNAPGIIIGGTSAEARNIISGNGYGVYLQTNQSGLMLQGNYIGTNRTGTSALPNNAGGFLSDGDLDNATIGGTAAGAGNVISGNSDL